MDVRTEGKQTEMLKDTVCEEMYESRLFFIFSSFLFFSFYSTRFVSLKLSPFVYLFTYIFNLLLFLSSVRPFSLLNFSQPLFHARLSYAVLSSLSSKGGG